MCAAWIIHIISIHVENLTLSYSRHFCSQQKKGIQRPYPSTFFWSRCRKSIAIRLNTMAISTNIVSTRWMLYILCLELQCTYFFFEGGVKIRRSMQVGRATDFTYGFFDEKYFISKEQAAGRVFKKHLIKSSYHCRGRYVPTKTVTRPSTFFWMTVEKYVGGSHFLCTFWHNRRGHNGANSVVSNMRPSQLRLRASKAVKPGANTGTVISLQQGG